MLLAVLWQNASRQHTNTPLDKKYNLVKYLSVLLITIGIALFMYKDGKNFLSFKSLKLWFPVNNTSFLRF